MVDAAPASRWSQRRRRRRHAAPPADPNKATFTVTLKTESGDDVVYENPPDTFILDATDELELTDEHELPYACRAGGCSSCAGKVLSGEVDASGCSFLEADQIAAGYILTCSAIPVGLRHPDARGGGPLLRSLIGRRRLFWWRAARREREAGQDARPRTNHVQ